MHLIASLTWARVVQMGASCITLLVVNGALAACCQSQASVAITSALYECCRYPCPCLTGSKGEEERVNEKDAKKARAHRDGQSGSSGSGSGGGGSGGGSGGGGSVDAYEKLEESSNRGGCCSPEASCGLACCGVRSWKGKRPSWRPTPMGLSSAIDRV